MREFKAAAQRDAVLENPIEIEFSVVGTVFRANPPSSGQLTVFMASQADADDPTVIAKGMLELLAAVLGEDYPAFEAMLKSGDIEMSMVMDIIEYLTETWSARPTQRASALSPSRVSTGKRSTARPRPKASTPST
jgi:hypothetical protein